MSGLSFEVIIIGGGLAGIMAAQAAESEGARVLLVDKGPVGRGTNTALANGLFASPTAEYPPEAFIRDTHQIGRGINKGVYVRQIAQEAPKTMDFLEGLGVIRKDTKGHFSVPTPDASSIPGLFLVKALAEKMLQAKGLTILRNFYVTELQRNERIIGVKGFDEQGRDLVLRAPAVILATGGAGAIYLRNDNQKGIMGQGYALAARAGLALRDMEFVQFYPLVLSEARRPSLLIYPPYPDSLRLTNAEGEDLLARWGMGSLNKATLTERDRLSLLLYEENQKGPVFLDCRQVLEEDWNALRASLVKKVSLDSHKRSLAVSPATHFFMGGLRTDALAQTRLRGLFACGEVVWGLHGANRRGGNALTECAVMGQIAGREAAHYARSHPFKGSVTPSEESGWRPGDKPAFDQLRGLRLKLREIAWNCAGILRREEGLRQGMDELNSLRTHLNSLIPQTIEDRRLKEDLLSGSLVLQAVLSASLGRKESRGSFNRLDYPREDNRNWLKNSCLKYEPEAAIFQVTYEPVNTDEDQVKDSDSV